MRNLRSTAPLLLGSLLLLAPLSPTSARADRPLIVGDGTAASCTETALRDALLVADTVGGATIRFDCGPAPVTILLSQFTDVPGLWPILVIPDNTTINGKGLVALDSALPEATMIFVDSGITATLTDLGIINGDNSGSPGGIENRGTLTIRRSTVSGHRNIAGGAGIQNSGILTIVDSTVADNHSRGGGTGISNAGTLEIRRTTFALNTNSDGGGGAIANSGTLTIDDSTFSGNRGDFEGGALVNGGRLTVRRSTFSENFSIHGGAIANHGTLVVRNSTFSGHIAALGGAIAGIEGSLAVSHSVFSGNDAGSGGGLRTYPGSNAWVTHSTFESNTAARTATAEGAGIANLGTLTLQHSRLSANAGALGGGIFNGGTLAIEHSIITSNTASLGGGIFVCLEGQEPPFSGGGPCHGTLSLTRSRITGNSPDDIFPLPLGR